MPFIKYCFMKTCENNMSLSAEKKFFTVPNDNKAQWCAAAGLDHVPTRSLFICEDHLNLEEDVENYLFWKTMNVNARLKPRVPVFRSPLPKVTNIVGPSTPTVGHFAESARVTRANRTENLTPVPVPDNPTLYNDAVALSSFCAKPEPQPVPCEPAATIIPEVVKNLCQVCGAVNDGYHFWCVSCGAGALCGACAATLTHELHFVLRAPTMAPKEQTQAVIAALRQQLENENLLTMYETEESEVKVEVKQEPEAPDPLSHLDPLAGLSEPVQPKVEGPQEHIEVTVTEGLTEAFDTERLVSETIATDMFVNPDIEVPQKQIEVTVTEGLTEAFDTERLVSQTMATDIFVNPDTEAPQEQIVVIVTEGLKEEFHTDRLSSETMDTDMDIEFIRETDDHHQFKHPLLMEQSIKPATEDVLLSSSLRSLLKHPNVIGSHTISNPAGPKTVLQVFQTKQDIIKNLRAKGFQPIKPKITRADQFKTSLEKHPIVIVKDSQTNAPSDPAGSKIGLHTFETKQIFRKKPQNKEIQLIKPKITRLDQYMTALEKYKKKLKKHMSNLKPKNCPKQNTKATSVPSIDLLAPKCPEETIDDSEEIEFLDEDMLEDDIEYQDLLDKKSKSNELKRIFSKYKKKPKIDYISDSDTESVLFTDDDKDKDYIIDEDDLSDDSMDETDDISERGIGRRTRNATKLLEKGPDEAMLQSLPIEATEALTSSQISEWTADRERRRED